MHKKAYNETYGIAAEFSSPDDLLRACERIRDAGYRQTDAYTPIPVHGLSDALGMRRSRMTLAVLLGGIGGCFGGLALQYWVSVITYPHIVSGKPLFSWPSFVPVIFECTILGAALTAFFGLILRNGLPQPYHPIFNTPRFELATTDRFFVCVEASDPKFNLEATRSFMDGLGADAVSVVKNHPDDPEAAA